MEVQLEHARFRQWTKLKMPELLSRRDDDGMFKWILD